MPGFVGFLRSVVGRGGFWRDALWIAVSGRFKNGSLPRYAFFKTRLKQGKLDKAATNLELALKEQRPSLTVYRDLFRPYWAQGRRDESVRRALA